MEEEYTNYRDDCHAEVRSIPSMIELRIQPFIKRKLEADRWHENAEKYNSFNFQQ